MLIRIEEEQDHEAVYAINTSAFESPAEAKLVNALREQAKPVISLVAEDNGEVVGHILFSPVSLSEHPDLRISGLAPMAVAPGRQRQGIGSALVREGLKRCQQAGFVASVVLGHPEFYPHFGYMPASRFNIGCEYEVPDEVFMATELVPGALSDTVGTIKYHAAFSSV